MVARYILSIGFETKREDLLRLLQGWSYGLLDDEDLVDIITKLLRDKSTIIWDIGLKIKKVDK